MSFSSSSSSSMQSTISNSVQQRERISAIHSRNQALKKLISDLGSDLYSNEMTFRSYVKELVYNFEELYTSSDLALSPRALFSLTLQFLRKASVSNNRIKFCYRIFDEEPDLRRFKLRGGELPSKSESMLGFPNEISAEEISAKYSQYL